MSNFIYPIINSWSSFKTEVTNRNMRPQWYDYSKGAGFNSEYKIYAQDGFFMFEISLEQNGSADVTDFETNYKNNWNTQLDYKDASGLPRVHTSPRPNDELTYFAGAGDDATNGVGEGNKLIFNFAATDNSKSIDLEYNEQVEIKDGVILIENAPLGSYLDLEIVHPVNGVIGAYARKIMLLGSGKVDINSEDFASVPYGLKIRITVYNSDGTGEQDPPAAFKVCGTLEMYRANTI